MGLLLIITNTQKLGCILFFIGCIPFLPIGFIGAFGARKHLNTIEEEKFLKQLDQ
ncbi:hypothetical protein [Aquimarina sp. AU58]|uniref:hypothetical protein n=1 Tax=Aquimarina sp. AU58 TaxID=1874112 RepID=UPI0013575F76|nr:hypothetical protein [Aquimarina sp. AU58]